MRVREARQPRERRRQHTATWVAFGLVLVAVSPMIVAWVVAR